jgi:UDP-glucose 4-epimerase
VLRYPNVYGPRQDPHGEAGVVAIFTGKMLSGSPVIINGDGEQERDFVYVGDCAHANLLALVKEKSGIFNLGSGKPTTVNEIYAHLRAITAYPLAESHGPAKLGETRKIYLDASKAHKELGWEQTVDLRQGLERTVAYFREREMTA